MLEDSSIFAKSYAARVPLYSEDHILEALKKETNDFVLGRVLQNPAAGQKSLDYFLEKHAANYEFLPFAFGVCFVDERVPQEKQQTFLKKELIGLHRKILELQAELARNSLPKM